MNNKITHALALISISMLTALSIAPRVMAHGTVYPDWNGDGICQAYSEKDGWHQHAC